MIVVDGSDEAVFNEHSFRWRSLCLHLAVDPGLETPNGKVGGALTGLRHAQYDRVVIADDDVCYGSAELARIVALLDGAEIVRPQNFPEPLCWNARWDASRSLLNRLVGGDWPGTLALRRSVLLATNGYRGDVLFENLELVRTVRAAGGRELVAFDLFVARHPSSNRHFLDQRVRQAYDEWARPPRLLLYLSMLPAMLLSRRKRRLGFIAGVVVLSVAGAETGRWRAGGTAFFPFSASLFAPLWLLERSVCVWIAVVLRLFRGGVQYRGERIRVAATPLRELRRRHGHVVKAVQNQTRVRQEAGG
ncbi:MAG: glycosyltransferase [Chloroflexota bacterium]